MFQILIFSLLFSNFIQFIVCKDNLHQHVHRSLVASNFTEVTPGADWSGRDAHSSVVYDDKIFVIGGAYDDSVSSVSDIWSAGSLSILPQVWTPTRRTISSAWYVGNVVAVGLFVIKYLK